MFRANKCVNVRSYCSDTITHKVFQVTELTLGYLGSKKVSGETCTLYIALLIWL